MDDAKIVPLLPWENVLFPGMLVPLEIIQPNDMLLVGDCLNRHGEFGMVLHADDSLRPQQVGTIARIIDYQPSGGPEMTLLVTGTERFILVKVTGDEPYLSGVVEPYPFVFDISKQELDDQAEQVRRLFNNCVKLIAVQRGYEAQSVLALPEQTVDLGWTIASALAIPPNDRQRLLEKVTPTALLQSEISYLQTLLSELREQSSLEES